jgi:cytochrome c oxidase subunit 4
MKQVLPSLSLVITFLILLALGALNYGLSFIIHNAFNAGITLAIMTVMVGIVLIGYMKLHQASRLVWTFGVAGFFWLMILYGLTATDYATRPPPGAGAFPSLRTAVPPPWESRSATER